MRTKGSKSKLGASIYKFCDAVNSFEGFFKNKDIVRISGLDRKYVNSRISYLVRNGKLRKLGVGVYEKKDGVVLTTNSMPNGFVAEAVYRCLDDHRQIFLTGPQVVALAEEEIIDSKDANAPVDIYSTTLVVLSLWNKSGQLVRGGQRGDYEYQLKPEIVERPVVGA